MSQFLVIWALRVGYMHGLCTLWECFSQYSCTEQHMCDGNEPYPINMVVNKMKYWQPESCTTGARGRSGISSHISHFTKHIFRTQKNMPNTAFLLVSWSIYPCSQRRWFVQCRSDSFTKKGDCLVKGAYSFSTSNQWNAASRPALECHW